MKTYGPLYVGKLRYWHKHLLPVIEVGHTQETDTPFRRGKCLVFRFPFTTSGYFIGLLRKSVSDPSTLTDEDIDLLMSKAMKARKAWTPEDGLYEEHF